MRFFLEIIYQWKKSLFDATYRCQYNQNKVVLIVEVVETNSFVIPVD